MKDQVRQLAKWFEEDRWPTLECPVCGTGTLGAGAISAVGNRATSTWREWGMPSDIEGIFFGHRICTNPSCGDIVAVAGDYIVAEPEWPSHDDDSYKNNFKVRTIYPPVPVVEVTSAVPEPVRKDLLRSAAVAWQDPSAGVSLLRSSIERLMDAQGIAATKADGSFQPLHNRLKEFDAINHDVAELLLAAKYVGNEGTHADLEIKDFLVVAEIVELALNMLYQKDTTALRQHAQRIVSAKGLVP